MTRRVYLVIGSAGVRRLADSGDVITADDGPQVAFAVTELVRQACPDDSEEDLEYDAFVCACRYGHRNTQGNQGRVVVASADLPDLLLEEPAEQADQARPGVPGEDDPARAFTVLVCGPVGLDRIACFHVEPQEADEDDELLWYDVSELHPLCAELG